MADSAKALTTSKLKTCRHGIQLIVKGMNKLFSLVWVLCITAVAIIGFFYVYAFSAAERFEKL